jgi:hypothetical protein
MDYDLISLFVAFRAFQGFASYATDQIGLLQLPDRLTCSVKSRQKQEKAA